MPTELKCLGSLGLGEMGGGGKGGWSVATKISCCKIPVDWLKIGLQFGLKNYITIFENTTGS